MSAHTASAIASRVCAGVACSCSQPCVGPQLLGLGRLAPAQQAQRLPVGRVDLAAVHRQTWRPGPAPAAARRSMSSATPPAPTGWDWRAIAQHPQPSRPDRRPPRPAPCATSRVGVWEISSSTTTVPAARPARPGRCAAGRSCGPAGRRSASSATALAVVATASHRPAVQPAAAGRGVQPWPSCRSRPGPAPPAASRPRRTTPAPPPPGRRPRRPSAANADATASRPSRGGRAPARASTRPSHLVLQRPVGGRRPLRRPPPPRLRTRG